MLAGLVFSLPALDWDATLEHCELFSGRAAVTMAEREEGRACAAFDYTYDNIYHDMNGPEGFTHALYHVLRLEPGSFLTLAPVCSTWVFMSRGSTGRSKSFPLGNLSAPSVQAGNCMVSRCAILLLLAAAKGVWFCLEQPRGSLLEYHPLIQCVLKLIKIYRTHIRMSDFAANSEKGTWLYSNRKEIEDIVDYKPLRVPKRPRKQLVVHYLDRSGKWRIKGSRCLKGSQEFGRALARLRTSNQSKVTRDARRFLRDAALESAGEDDGKAKNFTREFNRWVRGANLEPVFQYLTQ
ncbi:unnamed protein product [Durusdinium trenchii]|uniref:Uncharacterized protein n=1 Tax=Durusdinium trenchii TaxID=1381693 RepID=A0ABP0N7E7_9DINO